MKFIEQKSDTWYKINWQLYSGATQSYVRKEWFLRINEIFQEDEILYYHRDNMEYEIKFKDHRSVKKVVNKLMRFIDQLEKIEA